MEEQKGYSVKITPDAEIYFLQLQNYLYAHNSRESIQRNVDKILDVAFSLNNNPYRGRLEDNLINLGMRHRFVLCKLSKRKDVKIIYFIEETIKTVFITDFFLTEMDDKKITFRSNP